MNKRPLRLMVLGPGKTGSLVAEIARERGHQVQTIRSDVNTGAAWLTDEHLSDIDVVVDFTTPGAVLANVAACLRAHKAMVVGTRVMTTSGMYGTITSVDAGNDGGQADSVVIEIAPGVEVQWALAAVREAPERVVADPAPTTPEASAGSGR